jgi:FeS assembly SUF system regulator
MTRDPAKLVTATQLAEETAVPAPTVAKVLKELAREGVLTSHRGVNGGYVLAGQPEDITVLQIIRALEGPVALTSCVDGSLSDCDVESLCPMRGNWDKVNLAVRSALGSVTLADMAMPMMAFDPPPTPATAPVAG